MTYDKSILNQITSATKELNKAADAATREIAALDQQLIDAGVGIEDWDGILYCEDTIWYDLRREEEFPAEKTTRIGFAKVDREWGIAVKVSTFIEDQDASGIATEKLVEEELKLLRKADRQTRIDAVPMLPEFLETLLKTINKRTVTLNQALGNLDSGTSEGNG